MATDRHPDRPSASGAPLAGRVADRPREVALAFGRGAALLWTGRPAQVATAGVAAVRRRRRAPSWPTLLAGQPGGGIHLVGPVPGAGRGGRRPSARLGGMR